MIRRLQEMGSRWQFVCDGFGIGQEGRAGLKKVAQEALKKDVRTYLLAFKDERWVRWKDISTLDPGDENDDISGWGGLAGFGSRFGEAVRAAANEAMR